MKCSPRTWMSVSESWESRDGGPFADNLARYEAAITQSPYLECIQRKLTQN